MSNGFGFENRTINKYPFAFGMHMHMHTNVELNIHNNSSLTDVDLGTEKVCLLVLKCKDLR